jgi:DNA-binding IclR family transcriptional regulator
VHQQLRHPATVELDDTADTESKHATDKSVMGRGLMVLESLSRAGCPLNLGELAKTTHLPKSTVHRICGQLLDLGLLDRVGTGFGLGLRIFEWGSKAERQRDLRRAAIPFLSDLHARLRETIHLGVLDGRDVIYVEKIEDHSAVRCPTTVGERRPAHATALGKAMLAFNPTGLRAVLEEPLIGRTARTIIAPGLFVRQMQRIRESGVSTEIEESFLGVACVASPILDSTGKPVGAISISSPTSRFNAARLAPAVRSAARSISTKLAESAY